MMNEKILFLYFSGTGNTLFFAEQLKQHLNENIEMFPIKNLEYLEQKIASSDIIGIFYPTYYIHAPRFVVNQIKNYKHYFSEKRILLFSTFAANLGYSLHDLWDVFANTNKVQGFSLRMPGNYYAEYGAFPKWYQEFLFDRSKAKIEMIAKKIIDDIPTELAPPNLLSKRYNKSAKQQLKTFHNLDKKFSTTDACVNCSLCKKVCPVDNITIDNGVFWKNKCEQCMACLQWCPQQAIQIQGVSNKRKHFTNNQISVNQLIRANHKR